MTVIVMKTRKWSITSKRKRRKLNEKVTTISTARRLCISNKHTLNSHPGSNLITRPWWRRRSTLIITWAGTLTTCLHRACMAAIILLHLNHMAATITITTFHRPHTPRTLTWWATMLNLLPITCLACMVVTTVMDIMGLTFIPSNISEATKSLLASTTASTIIFITSHPTPSLPLKTKGAQLSKVRSRTSERPSRKLLLSATLHLWTSSCLKEAFPPARPTRRLLLVPLQISRAKLPLK